MAGTIMRSTQFRAVVEPILNQSFDGVYDQRTDEYKQIFSEENGIKRAYHEEPVLYGFGAAPKLPDGQPVVYDEGGQLFTKRYDYDVYGLAFALTKVLVEDGEHVRLGTIYSKHLAQSMDETLETVTANHLNRAFTSGYNGGDGGIAWKLPVYADAFGQLDGSIFYRISDNVQIGLEMNNLNNAEQRTIMEQVDAGRHVTSWFVNDRRYAATIRMTF